MREFRAVHDGECMDDFPVMTNVLRVCRKCGAEIFADAPEGLCTACLFETGLDLLVRPSVAAGDDCALIENVESSDANAAPHVRKAPRPPKTLAEFGDYELLEEIGRGGQGVVYRARQRSLNRTVALKVIGLGHWATQAHLKRFRLEAEAAASLEHPGIVPIHEVGERDGSCYFSMKFVEGGQLDAVAKREPIPPRRAAELIAKIARIVHYAHEHHILHRDIKPGNILLDQKGEPHLTDFGLARLVETESTVTRTMEVLGTPSYMAPEQAVGNNAQLTSATDVYGLGAVLYQLLTGHPPFAGGTTYETIRLVLDTEPRQPRLWSPKVDRDVSTICLKCLEKDPKRRYSSALALAEDLERWLKHEPIQARRSGIFARSQKWMRRSPTSALLAASLVALSAAAGWIVWKSEFVRPLPTTGIAVLPFENLSGDSGNGYFANGIQEEILTRLAGIADLKVISRTSTQQYQSKPRNLREIAKQLGVANILEGSVQKAADQVRVNVQLVNAQTDSHLWADTYDRKLTDILGVESEIAKQIAESLQAKITGREEQALAIKPTNNPEAYDAYLRALALIHFESDYEALERALQTLKQAVELDPNFAAAWALLARIQAQAYSWGTEHTEVDRVTATKALETALRLQPELAEVQMAQGYYQYYILRDWNAARQTFELLRRRWPSNADIVTTLGLIAEYQGRWKEALKYHDDAIALSPRDLDLRMQACFVRYSVHDFTAELRMLDQVLTIWPDNTNAILEKVGVYQVLGQLAQAEALLSRVRADDLRLGDWLGGRQIESQALLSRDPAATARAITFFRNHTDPPNSLPPIVHAAWRARLGRLEQLSGQTNEARAHFTEAREEFEQQLKEQEQHPGFMKGLAEALAGLGEREAALREADLLVERVPSSSDAINGPACEEYRARTQARFGDADHAIPTLKYLLKTSYGRVITPALLRLDPDFDPLRGDPRFQKLCEEKQP